ncbi:MAG TPA: hypothetical protein VMW08_01075 [Acidimicrobiales bacterium]|nr:hypothetical protein [Acidimicrobiales bacterium]
MARCGGCNRVVIPPGLDNDALVHAPVAGVLADATRSNWLTGLPTVSGAFANNQGDPTSTVIAGDYSAIVGGLGNLIDTNPRSVILAGQSNVIDAAFGSNAIVAGDRNTVTLGGASAFAGHSATIGGQDHQVETHNTVIAGGSFHSVLFGAGPFGPHSVFIGGGFSHTLSVNSERSAIIGGQSHTITASNDSAMTGGEFNDIVSSPCAAILGGASHLISSAPDSACVAGDTNTISTPATYAFLGGGQLNATSGRLSAIIGGRLNTVTAIYSAIAGGIGSTVAAGESFACCSGSVPAGTARGFAHGTGPADRVGFRGVAPVPAPVLAPLPPPTGIPGLDAWIASVDVALKSQGHAV